MFVVDEGSLVEGVKEVYAPGERTPLWMFWKLWNPNWKILKGCARSGAFPAQELKFFWKTILLPMDDECG